MLRKNTAILLIFLLQSVLMVAQESRFKDDETIHVWASSGLNMRSKPDAKAEKIATIPYGAKVVVLPNIGVKIPFEVEEFKGFVVKGYWLLVKYENTEGFVFDGFLSRLPAPKPNKQDFSILIYLNNQIGKVGSKIYTYIFDKNTKKRRVAKSTEKYNEKDIVGFAQKYEFDIFFSCGTSPGGGDLVISSTNFSLFESYFLIKTYFIPKIKILTFDEKNKYININGDKCDFNINQINNETIIDGYCQYLERH